MRSPSSSEVSVDKVPVQWLLSQEEFHPKAEAAALVWAPAAAANSFSQAAAQTVLLSVQFSLFLCPSERNAQVREV